MRVSSVVLLGAVLCACPPAPVLDPDAGEDAGFDAGAHDAGIVDAGSEDAGSEDAGSADAGFHAGTDAGSSCGVSAPGGVFDFPPTVPGCVVQRRVTLRNTCDAGEAISLSTTGPFSVDAGVFTVRGRGTTTIPFWFSPTTLGMATGVASGTASSGPISIPLRGEGVTSSETTDRFRQETRPKLDMLLVVSDGPGMAAVQTRVAQTYSSLLQYAASNQVDFQIAVLAGRADGGSLVQGSPNAPLVLSSSTPSLEQHFIEKISLGAAGSPTTSCLMRAIDELSSDASWLRENAPFMLVCVQNTPEQLTGNPLDWLATLDRTVGSPARLNVSAYGVFTPGCPAPDDAVLRQLGMESGGTLTDSCTFSAVGQGPTTGSAFGYNTVFRLSRPTTSATSSRCASTAC